jgi:hypothetical protein
MVRVDEARHHDAPARIDDGGAAGVQVGPTGDDLLASTSTSACAKSPTFGSIDITAPPRIR